jgi:ATP-binding cassette subfamily B (MDR/TAP) protein 1
MTEPEP